MEPFKIHTRLNLYPGSYHQDPWSIQNSEDSFWMWEQYDKAVGLFATFKAYPLWVRSNKTEEDDSQHLHDKAISSLLDQATANKGGGSMRLRDIERYWTEWMCEDLVKLCQGTISWDGTHEMDCPKFYNYRDDEIYVDFEAPDIGKWREFVRSKFRDAGFLEDFKKLCLVRFRSRDGYVNYVEPAWEQHFAALLGKRTKVVSHHVWYSFSLFFEILWARSKAWDLKNGAYENPTYVSIPHYDDIGSNVSSDDFSYVVSPDDPDAVARFFCDSGKFAVINLADTEKPEVIIAEDEEDLNTYAAANEITWRLPKPEETT